MRPLAEYISVIASDYSRSHDAVIRVYDDAGNANRDAGAQGRFPRALINFFRASLGLRPRCLEKSGDHPKGIQMIAPKRCQAMRVGFVSPLHRWMSRITARSGSSLPEELDQPHGRVTRCYGDTRSLFVE